MAKQLITGNYAAGIGLHRAGQANRTARGCVAGVYPITPQTEIIEYLAAHPIEKGRIVTVESEHSAMAVCIGASLNGARAFTASSSNGLAYMAENVFVAGYYRLPIVMAAVNRTLGPPWNIWVDQGDTLMLRDGGWVQLYCETPQEVHDSTLMAFRIAEDRRILMPVLVIMDAFILSHTSSVVDVVTQEQADRYLPPCVIPHALDPRHPVTVGGLAWPRETASMRHDHVEAMDRVEEVFDEAQREFAQLMGRMPDPAVACYRTEDAETILVTSGTITSTAREVVDTLRDQGVSIGLCKIKMFRPFPRRQISEALGAARRIAVIDRNLSLGSGGIFWQEVRATLSPSPDTVIQGYVVGLGGSDVTPDVLREVVEDVRQRKTSEAPIWKGVAA